MEDEEQPLTPQAEKILKKQRRDKIKHQLAELKKELGECNPKCPVCFKPTEKNLKPNKRKIKRKCDGCNYTFILEANTDCTWYTTYKADCINGKTNQHKANLLLKHDDKGFYKKCQACGYAQEERSVVFIK